MGTDESPCACVLRNITFSAKIDRFPLLYDPLFFFNDKTGVTPAIASSYEVGEDGSLYTIHIREGALFHDGSQIKASDVVFSIERAMKASFISRFVSHVDTAAATDDLTVSISFCEAEHDHLATPWSDAASLWDRSPLKYADRVRTPPLLIHSDLDMHCCMADALQMLTAMKYHGVESRLCLFHGENHDLSRPVKPVNRMRRLREITNWFDLHGGSPTE